MPSKHKLFLTLFTVSTLLGVQACNNSAERSTASTSQTCMLNSISQACILKNAEAVLADIEDNYAWVTSASELALAFDSNAQTDSAWKYMEKAVSRLNAIQDVAQRDGAAADLALALKSFKRNNSALSVIATLETYLESVENESEVTDISCKIVSAKAVHDNIKQARKLALALPQESSTANAFRGRTQREIVTLFAKKGDFDTAIDMLDEITADFDYYKAIAHTDVMSIAAKAGKVDIVKTLKPRAEAIAMKQENTYFTTGILRDIAHSYILLEKTDIAQTYLDRAVKAGAKAPKFQEKARSTSRIATRIADTGRTEGTKEVLQASITLASEEKSELMQNYSLYEIAGAAAFSQNFDMSKSIVEDLPDEKFFGASSLKAAGQRDLAWGLVRAKKIQEGIDLANSITAPREKVHTLSRIVRLLNNPTMNALPRYL